MQVRDATEDDLPAITALYNTLIATTTVAWRDEPSTLEEQAQALAGRDAAGYPTLVADDGGEVVGYTCCTTFRGDRFPGYRHTAELTVHVRGDRHSQGIGSTLIEALVERSRDIGLHVLVAAVDEDNDASIRFHEALGFSQVARMPEVGRKFDRWLTLVLLQRLID
ncbi:MAG: N-acetyltransferase family protein [Acidimicrobiales bacterium]